MVWPSMLCLAAAVLLAQQLTLHATMFDRRWSGGALGSVVALSYTVRPTNAIVVLGFTCYALISLRPVAKWYLIGASVVAAPWIAVNLATFGSVLPPYNTASRLSIHSAYFEALAANLVSPARGLVMFSPVVLFVCVRWTRRVDQHVRPELRSFDLLLLLLVGFYLVSASALTENWWAGHSYGPRFMSDTIVLIWCLIAPVAPAVLDAARPRAERRRSTADVAVVTTAALALGWSVIANAEGGLMRSTLCWNGEPNIDKNVDRIWSVSDGQIISGFLAISESGVREATLTPCGT
jgi:hypothetical protein